MVKYIIILLTILFFGCETNSKQIIKPEKFNYDLVIFDTVSKKLSYDVDFNSFDNEIITEIIQYWFDNRIKTNGFNGNLLVNVKNIELTREKKKDYYKFSILLTFEIIQIKNQKKIYTYNVNSNEYGEMEGSFSINDQENFEINIMHKSLESISVKLNEII